MALPFTAEQFFDTFACYNVAVWSLQFVLLLLAVVAMTLPLLALRRFARLPGTVLALLWLWLAFGYRVAFFARINPAAWVFRAPSLAGTAAFPWFGVAQARLRIELCTRLLPCWPRSVRVCGYCSNLGIK